MSKMYDAAFSVSLRDLGENPVTATGMGTSIILERATSYWADQTLALPLTTEAAIVVEDIDVSGNQTYTLAIVAANNPMMEDTVQVAGGLSVRSVGRYALTFDRDHLHALFPTGPVRLALAWTITGDDPSLQLGCWLT